MYQQPDSLGSRESHATPSQSVCVTSAFFVQTHLHYGSPWLWIGELKDSCSSLLYVLNHYNIYHHGRYHLSTTLRLRASSHVVLYLTFSFSSVALTDIIYYLGNSTPCATHCIVVVVEDYYSVHH